MIALDVVSGLGTLWGILPMALRAKDEKKNLDRYKKSPKVKRHNRRENQIRRGL
ncbi:MAG: hypothetical protein IIZ39_02760 [Blautia sp.]|nr:hypothetical protein [Blautia sp.]